MIIVPIKARFVATAQFSQLGVVAGTEVALANMSQLQGGQGGLIVNTASLAGVKQEY